MATECYVINKDYAFNLTDREKNKRIPSEHGLIKCILRMSYYCNRESAKSNGFDESWISIKDAGWNTNYLKSEIEAIYDYVVQNAYFINKNKVDFSKHVVARL